MDPRTMKNESSEQVMFKFKKVKRLDPVEFAKYFKSMPSHFVESSIFKEMEKGRLLPSSAFVPRINSHTLLYDDLIPNPVTQ